MKKTILAMTVSVMLTACGGGGGTEPQKTQSVTQPNPTTEAAWQRVDLIAPIDKSTVTSMPAIWLRSHPPFVVDINQDGYDDLVFALDVVDPLKGSQAAVRPVVLVYDAGRAAYVRRRDIEQVIEPVQQIRQVLVLGPTIFIADAGYDETSYGAANQMLIKDAKGQYQQWKIAQYRDYTHDAVSADFDLDQREEILVINNKIDQSRQSRCHDAGLAPEHCPYQALEQRSSSYWITFKGSEPQVEPFAAPKELEDIFQGTNSDHRDRLQRARVADVNQDGRPDLVVTTNREVIVLENKGMKTWHVTARFLAGSCANDSEFQSVRIQDLDGDQRPEIITTYRCNQDRINRFQVLGQVGGQWQNQTDRYFDSSNQDPNWGYEFEFVDLDQDGRPDLVQNGSVRWFRRQADKFVADVIPYSRWGQTVIRLGTKVCTVSVINQPTSLELESHCRQ